MMKGVISIMLMMGGGVLIGQPSSGILAGVKILDRQQYKETDTIPKVIYEKDNKSEKQPFIYINGEKLEGYSFETINFDLIEKMEVEKEAEYKDDENYFGSVFIDLKNEYKPKLISLNQLKAKYVKETANPTLFLLNEKPINEDSDNFMVDEKFIMKIVVEEIINEKESLNLNIIKLITRTEDNLKEANTIYIRGDKPN